MKKTLVVNLFSGPGAGKSTFAALLFAELKFNKITTEIITEYAKELVWEESFPKLKNQVYIFGKQHNKQFRLNGKVDVIVTDSPFVLSVTYDDNKTKFLKEIAISEHHKYHNLNIFLERTESYDPNGRTQKTINEAIERDVHIKTFLDENDIKYKSIYAIKENIAVILDLINKELENGSNK